ncbi:MAG: Asp-tRNA(Asn)/Glu-tRNA(Gln) amidotransferase subunit GatB [Phycisphaerae bacterium]|jgi:aspartyl-tRNA(Asn)/glutamyl-tRNA(Gln) amidotransferase subunit B|nr:Asp-tRNA(Asn)/Glu-tRNA(Gln) amidotransferase subunit GatB [Phycisphaerae bacterium]
MTDNNDIIKPIIGLEIHVELATETKMFCRCRNHFGDPPNTNVCPVCIGMPGALPVMNALAVEYSLQVGMALGCQAPDFTKWDRKSYYYPDLPKGYQLSQYDLPLTINGVLEVVLEDGSTKAIRVLRAHLEEDAGKNIHDNPAHTRVDLNRAGVPLLEIVSEPDMNSAEEALAYGRAMQRLVRWLGASHANMQMGHMRFEPNINLHITRDGVTYKTPIIEVKNLNSFRALENSITFEIDRQYAQWSQDNSYTMENFPKQNRGYNDATEQTVFQRGKEEAHDYRYFPDPDLVPVLVDDKWRACISESIGELPLARRKRYIDQYGLTFKDADALTMDPATGDLLDAAVQDGADAKRCVKLLLGRGAAIANEKRCTIAETGVTAPQLSGLVQMLSKDEVNATSASKIFDMLTDSDLSAQDIAKQEDLLAVTDSGAIETWVQEAIDANPQAVEEIRSGGKKAQKSFGFLMGQVMQKSRGAAPPARVKELLDAKLAQ